MKVPFFIIVIGRLARYYPQALVWFVVGMVSFHTVLRVMGVSWYDILMFWSAFFGGVIGATIVSKIMARKKARDEATEAEWEAAWTEDEDYTRTKE